MQRQMEMEQGMALAHHEFMANLEKSIGLLEKDIDEAGEMIEICTDEWCASVEGVLDELAKLVYSISEPRWVNKEDSGRIRDLRSRIHDIYFQYKNIKH
ncbi:MAG: hypothetical protein KQH63_18045 [Desulfobulbaceae bacterium]|nr:hypothetical protein [Desulfobulbaceae bacterium]